MLFKPFSPLALVFTAQAAMFSVASVAASAGTPTALITTDATHLRAAPRDSAQQQAVLWPGERVEVRGERMDYVQVWDHRRERGGYVRASQLRRTPLQAVDAPELLAQVRLVQGTPGSEALGIGLAAAYIEAAPAQALQGLAGLEVFDALGTMADRLARRASSGQALGKSAETSLAAHLEVAARYGLQFASYEQAGRMQVCYEGEMFRRVLGMAPALRRDLPEPQLRSISEMHAHGRAVSEMHAHGRAVSEMHAHGRAVSEMQAHGRAVSEMQARAALGLTRLECTDPQRPASDYQRLQVWRADVLDKVDLQPLPVYLKNRVHMRRATVFSSLAYLQARRPDSPDGTALAQRAISELASVSKTELPDDDQPAYNDAAMRVNASRWAAVPFAATATSRLPQLMTAPGQPGETCVLLVDAQNNATKPLARRCTFSVVWPQSATANREGTALALAVQPMEAWRELWVFQKTGSDWRIDVLPPATFQPELGYAEFAGWVPGGAQMLVAREARGNKEDGARYRRAYEVTRLADLSIERQSPDPSTLGAFQRWQDPLWKKGSVSVR